MGETAVEKLKKAVIDKLTEVVPLEGHEEQIDALTRLLQVLENVNN